MIASLTRGKRTFVRLCGESTSAVVLAAGTKGTEKITARFTAYEMTCARHLTVNERRNPFDDTREILLGRRVINTIDGDVCYAFYSKHSQAVKLGRTREVMRRWARLETASGMALQLLIVWQIPDSRAFESMLFERYAPHRRLGEWFAADPVIDDLKARLPSCPQPPSTGV